MTGISGVDSKSGSTATKLTDRSEVSGIHLLNEWQSRPTLNSDDELSFEAVELDAERVSARDGAARDVGRRVSFEQAQCSNNRAARHVLGHTGRPKQQVRGVTCGCACDVIETPLS